MEYNGETHGGTVEDAEAGEAMLHAGP